MSNFNYEAAILWDVILVPAAIALVLTTCAAAAYYDMRRDLSNDSSKRLYLLAFLGYLVTTFVVVIQLAVDLWIVARAIEDRHLGRWVETLLTVVGCVGGLSFVLAVAATTRVLWLRAKAR